MRTTVGRNYDNEDEEETMQLQPEKKQNGVVHADIPALANVELSSRMVRLATFVLGTMFGAILAVAIQMPTQRAFAVQLTSNAVASASPPCPSLAANPCPPLPPCPATPAEASSAVALPPAAAPAVTAGGINLLHGRSENGPNCILNELWNLAGSDKTKSHNYGRAYCQLFTPRAFATKIIVEIGINRGGSTAGLARFFPNAHAYGIDVRVDTTGDWASLNAGGKGAGKIDFPECKERCHFVHVERGKDGVPTISDKTYRGIKDQTGRYSLPLDGDIDIFIDDADHSYKAQQKVFDYWFPKVRPGGLYIIEDIFVIDFPSRNQQAGQGYFFPQCPADHPFADLRTMPANMRKELENRDFIFAVTGTHPEFRGGLDVTMIITK